MNRFFIVAFVIFAFLPCGSRALDVRQSDGDGYVRTVFEWSEDEGKIAYEVSKSSSGGIEIAFNQPANISDGEMFSVSTSDPLRVLFPVDDTQTLTHFALGRRIFIDVHGKATKDKAQVSKAHTPTKKPQVKKVDGKKAKPPSKASPLLRAVDDRKKKEQAALASKHIVGFASTSPIWMASFTRDERLWIVVQPKENLASPQVSVANGKARTIGEFFSQQVGGATVWSVEIDKNAFVAARGAGLSWEISIDNKKPQTVKPIKISHIIDENGNKAVFIPVSGKLIKKPIKIGDPLTGAKNLIVITSLNASIAFREAAKNYVDFEIIPSAVGIVIRPKVDDLSVDINDDGVVISKTGGLAILKEKLKPHKKAHINKDAKSIYTFNSWLGGSILDLSTSKNSILEQMHEMPKELRVQSVLTLAKMYLAHGRGSEALGFLKYAQMQVPDLIKTPEFLAWRGAARVLSGRSEKGFSDLSHPSLQDFADIPYWRAFALSKLEDWNQAAEILPFSGVPIEDYPQPIKTRLALSLAEISLRAGEIDKGVMFLNLAEVPDEYSDENSAWAVPFNASKEYLLGEVERQKGNENLALSHWIPLSTGIDNMYRAKSTLAMTRLLYENGKISENDAIDNLEQVRYIWRGDGLEAQVLFWLGRMYFIDGQHIKSLTLMRKAASIVPETDLASTIIDQMYLDFEDLFTDPAKLSSLSPMEAAALYEEFGELTPTGAKGDAIVAALIDHLIEAGLFERGAEMLDKSIQHRLYDGEKTDALIRLSALYLTLNRPDDAISKMNEAAILCKKSTRECDDEISLLRAKALSKKGSVDKAMEILSSDIEPSEEFSRAKADVAWHAERWSEAAEALGDILRIVGATPDKKMQDEWVDMILRRAIALRLAGLDAELLQWRASWINTMKPLPQGAIFSVVSEPSRRSTQEEDAQQWKSSVGDADLFGEFLRRYNDGKTDNP